MSGPALTLETKVDSSKANSGLESFKEKVKTVTEESVKDMGEFGSVMSKMGPLIGGALLALGTFKEVVAAAFEKSEEIKKMSEEFDINTQKVQTLTSAAKFYGATTEDLSKSLGKLQQNTEKLMQGSDEQVKSFADLGLKAEDLKGMSIDEVFEKVSDSVSHATDKKKAYLAVEELMGKSSKELIEMLNAGSDAIEQQGNSTVKLSDSAINIFSTIKRGWGVVWDDIVDVGGNAIGWLIQGMGSVGTVVVSIAGAAVTSFESLGVAIWDSLHGNFHKAVQDIKDGNAELVENLKQTQEKINKIWNPEKEDKGGADANSVFNKDDSPSAKDLKEEEDVQKKIQEIGAQTAEKKDKALFDEMTNKEKLLELDRKIAEQQSLADPSFMGNTSLQKAEATAKMTDLQLEKEKMVNEYKKKSEELGNKLHDRELQGDGSISARIAYLKQQNEAAQALINAGDDINASMEAELLIQDNNNELKKLGLELTKQQADAEKKHAEDMIKISKATPTGTVRRTSKGAKGDDILGNYNNYINGIEDGHNTTHQQGMNPQGRNLLQDYSKYMNSTSGIANKNSQSDPLKTQTVAELKTINRSLATTVGQLKLITQGNLGSGDGSFASA